MVRAQIRASSLADFYGQIVQAQCDAHGPEYCSHHLAIWQAASECESYLELGVNQGATLACAVLAGFRRVMGIDLSLEPFRAFEGLFRGRATVLEQDSRRPLPRPHEAIDFLFIDSLHEAAHMREELRVHGPNVRKYVLAHDTAKYPALAHELERWAALNLWTVHEQQASGAGHILLRSRHHHETKSARDVREARDGQGDTRVR